MATPIREYILQDLEPNEDEHPVANWPAIVGKIELRIKEIIACAGKPLTCNVEIKSGKRKGQLCGRPLSFFPFMSCLKVPGWEPMYRPDFICQCRFHSECYGPVLRVLNELEK
jgi:hypothetical protein